MTFVITLATDETVARIRRVGSSQWVEVRGAPDYTRRYDPADPLHQFLDSLDPPSACVVLTYVEYTINAKNPRSQDALVACEALFAANP